MRNTSVFVAAERDNAAIRRWDGERLELDGGESIRLQGHRCLVCGGTEQVEPRARSLVTSNSTALFLGLFLLWVLPPLGTLFGLAIIFCANQHVRVTFPLCGGCELRGLAVETIGWMLGVPAFVVCPIVGGAIGELLDGRHSFGMLIAGFAVGLVGYLCLVKLWQTLLTSRVAVTCAGIDDDSVTLRVPCRGAVDDMVAPAGGVLIQRRDPPALAGPVAVCEPGRA